MTRETFRASKVEGTLYSGMGEAGTAPMTFADFLYSEALEAFCHLEGRRKIQEL